MKINVTLQNLTSFTNLEIDDKKNEAILNGKKIELDIPPFASRLLTIISKKKEKMVNYFIIDGESYSVKVEKDGKVYEYEGRNKFPKNYRDFINLLKSNGIC